MTGIANGHAIRSRSSTRHALLKRLIRMSCTVVITTMLLRHVRITAIENVVRIFAVMAVMMVGHIRIHISLIVVQINRAGVRIVTWPMTVIIRRSPRIVSRTTEMIP